MVISTKYKKAKRKKVEGKRIEKIGRKTKC